MPDAARESSAATLPHPDDVRAYVDYLRDLGVYDLLAQDSVTSSTDTVIAAWATSHLRSALSPVSTGHPATASGRSGAAQANRSELTVESAAPLSRPATLSPFEPALQRRGSAPPQPAPSPRRSAGPEIQITPPVRAQAAQTFEQSSSPAAANFTPDMPAPTPFNQLAPLPATRLAPADKPAALQALREHIGDCTRCPLA